MIDIQIATPDFNKTGVANLRKAASLTLKNISSTKKSSLTILICDDEYICQLNSQYRNVDSPTDVLSFPSGAVLPDSLEVYLGDIAISYETALKQAALADHPVEDELSLLVVHGVLHLAGYDHHTDSDKKEMWLKQSVLLQQLNIRMDHFSGDD